MAATFPGVLSFAFMAVLILTGVFLRAKIPILQSALIPASLLGGVIGFTILSLGLAPDFKSEDFVAFAFHFFTLSFMSLVLTGKNDSRGGGSTSVSRGGWWLAIGWVMSLAMQAIVGLIVIVVFDAATGGDLSYFLGIIVTHGFTQGPGQALAMGSIWESEFNIDNAVNFGLIYASMGFVVSFVAGVPAARYAIKRGLNTNLAARLDHEFLVGIHDVNKRPVAGYLITHSANVDSLVYHLGVLGVAYLITHFYLINVSAALEGVLLAGVPVRVLFSHNLFFIHGLLVCLVIRGLMDRFGYGHLIDNETQKRITGSSVDLMMVATILSIQFSLLTAYLVPILLVVVAVSVTTGLMCFAFGRLLGSLPVERAITLFGCCTGSTGSGLLLLRILDPDLSTSVARELAFFNVAILFHGMHILTFMAPVLPSIDLVVICIVYITTVVAGGVALWVLSPKT